MMGYYEYGIGYFGWIFMVLFWGAVIWLMVWIVTKNKQPAHPSTFETPLDILKLRYAKGEISKKEYIEMRNELSRA